MAKKTKHKNKSKKYKNQSVKNNIGVKKVEETEEKSSRKKKIIIASIIAAVVIIATVVILAIVLNKPNSINVGNTKNILQEAGYKLDTYVPEAAGLTGVTETISAVNSPKTASSLADFVNSKKESVYLIVFDTEQNAIKAYEDFKIKWGARYEAHNILGNVIYFGTTNAVKLALESAEKVQK